MTWLDEIPPEEQRCVEELKKRCLADVSPKTLEDPSLFYRFCKARNFNLKQAEAMLRKHILWRKEFNVDTILTDFKAPEVLTKYAPISPLGFDKEGSPIQYIAVSAADSKGIIKSTKKTDMLKFNIQFAEKDMELLRQQSQKLGKLITKVVAIHDYNKMTFAKATCKEVIEYCISWISMFQDNYPERVKSVYIINASIYFTIFFSVLKTVVAASIIDKIHCFGTDGWKEALCEIIDPDELPAFLGGNKTDPDGNPLCKSFVIQGETVPEHYYLQKSKRTFYKEQGVKKLTVERFSSSKLAFDVDECGSILEWEFETKSKDIAFGVYFKKRSNANAEPISLVPKQRIDTCIEPEAGIYRCEKAGTYVIIFDNSYSWMHTKEIYYRATVRPPNNQEDEE